MRLNSTCQGDKRKIGRDGWSKRERGGRAGLQQGQVCLLSPQAYVTYQQCKLSKVQGWIGLCLEIKVKLSVLSEVVGFGGTWVYSKAMGALNRL